AQARPCTPAKLTQRRAPMAQRRAGYRQARDGQEPPEEAGPPGGAVAAPVPAPLEALQQRQLRSAPWPAQGEAGGAPPRALAAPGSGARKRGKARGLAVGDTGPPAGDRPPKRMVAHDVPPAPGARACRSPLARPAQERRGSPGAAGAAVGAYHGE